MILLPKSIGSAMVDKVISDNELTLLKPFDGNAAIALLEQVDDHGARIGTSFNFSPHVDQSKMFTEVVNRLAKNNAIGIFPEGGSHDRPEMLPLKAGVSVMALETLAKYPGTKLRIVPCGLHYFHADKFRSRAAVEYGEIIEVPIELVDQYKLGGKSKREAIGLLLDTIHVRLKALTVQAPDYDSLMVPLIDLDRTG
jgi:glycerol-3-phosphate O-acyltransferase / dihydroxyacetone phosphate acyltransferase